MEISGVIKNSSNGSNIPGIEVQLWSNSKGKYLGVQDITDINGEYYVVSDYLNDPDTFVSTNDPSGKYGQTTGSPDFFKEGDILLDVISPGTKIPWWVWVILAIGVLMLLNYFKSKKL